MVVEERIADADMSSGVANRGAASDHGEGVSVAESAGAPDRGMFQQLAREDENIAKIVTKAVHTVMCAVVTQRLEDMARQIWQEARSSDSSLRSAEAAEDGRRGERDKGEHDTGRVRPVPRP